MIFLRSIIIIIKGTCDIVDMAWILRNLCQGEGG